MAIISKNSTKRSFLVILGKISEKPKEKLGQKNAKRTQFQKDQNEHNRFIKKDL